MSVGVCYTAVDAAAGGSTTGWWAVVLECFSSHPLMLVHSQAVKNMKLHDFLANDFTLPRWRSAAAKNAFSLLSKQQHELAVAFFLLAGDVESAVRVSGS